MTWQGHELSESMRQKNGKIISVLPDLIEVDNPPVTK